MNKKIIFMGTPSYATVILKKLIEADYEIVALFTQEDKKVGRKQILKPPHIKQYILDENINIPIFQPQTLKQNGIKEIVTTFNPDFIIVAAYGQILPQNILDIAPCINLHASLLPKYRGASPIQQCLLNNDNYTGVTAINMEIGLDSGDILGWKYLKIEDYIDVESLFNKLAIIASDLTIEVINNYNSIKPIKQNILEVSHCGKITKEDGMITFDDAFKIFCKYRAYKVWPQIYLNSGFKLKELKLNETNSNNNEGKILEIKQDYIVVACKKGSLKIIRVQAPSKKEINVVDYIRGKQLKVGDILN